MNRVISKAIASWKRWRFLRSNPELRDLAMKRTEASRKHRATREIERRMNEITLNNLRAR